MKKSRITRDKNTGGEDYTLEGLAPVWLTVGKMSVHVMPDRDGGVNISVYDKGTEAEKCAVANLCTSPNMV